MHATRSNVLNNIFALSLCLPFSLYLHSESKLHFSSVVIQSEGAGRGQGHRSWQGPVHQQGPPGGDGGLFSLRRQGSCSDDPARVRAEGGRRGHQVQRHAGWGARAYCSEVGDLWKGAGASFRLVW